MVSQAEQIKNSIETNWSLTGLISKTATASMMEPVRFFDRDQVLGNEVTKAIVVRKINDEGDENIIRHPKFIEVTDVYSITVYYRVTDVDKSLFSTALTNVEDMAREVQSILRTLYNPLTGTGTYFITRSTWNRNDFVDQAQPELRRTLQFELTQIQSGSTEVYRGYKGVLAFDTSESVADTKNGSDYAFTEAYDVELEEGWDSIPYMTNDVTRGQNVPSQYTGAFSGTFRCEMFAKKSDFNATTVERLHKMYLPQAAGALRKELPIVAFLHTESDTGSSVLNTTSYVKVTSIRKQSQVEQLTRFFVTGIIYKPSTMVIT